MFNPSVAGFSGAASQQYIFNSPDTLDALRDEYMNRDLNMSAEDAVKKARANMTATHSLSSFTSGEVPVDSSWDEALQAVGLPTNVQELVFNEENTRVIMADAGAGSVEELLQSVRILLPHQVKGKCPRGLVVLHRTMLFLSYMG